VTVLRRRILLDARKARDFGIGTYIRGLLGGLAGFDRYDLHALVIPGDEPLLPKGVTSTVCDAPHYSFAELVAVRRAISKLETDIFHAPHYVVPFFPPRATVVTIHDLMHLTRPEHTALAKRAYARWMIGRALRLSAAVIAGSEETKKEILAFGPEQGGKVTVIGYGVREDFLESEEKKKKKKKNVASYLLFLGNDKPHKNLDGLLRAWPLVRAAHPGVSLVLAGAAQGRTLPEGVKALGWVSDEDLPALVADARALVLPSFAEGFGLPVIEAQAAGTPVACSDIPALRESAGDLAVFFDPSDISSIADALNSLLGDEEKRRLLGKRGKERAAQFTWRAVAERTAALYEDVLSSSPSKEKTPSEKPGHHS